MNILWITMESILPANSGGRLGVFKRLEQISHKANVFLFYPYDNEDESQHIDELKKMCVEVHGYYRKDNRIHALFNLWKYPFTVGSRDIEALQNDVGECLRKNNIDLINVDFPHMCVNLLGQDIDKPIVLNEHNIEWCVYRTIAKSKKNLLSKFAYWIDSYRLKKYEETIFAKIQFKKVTFVSDRDMEHMLDVEVINSSQATLIPVGADVNNCCDSAEVKNHNILFVGKMSYGPNIEAVKWFVKEIFPRIKKHVQDAKFYIVGKDPVDEVCKFASDDVIVTGQVDTVDKYYHSSKLVVLPLKNGGGVKVKLLEAISFHKPIVSTTVGVEGTIYANNKTIRVTDDEIEFANKAIEVLLSNGTELDDYYKIFIENYTWQSVGNKYYRMMEEVCSNDGK